MKEHVNAAALANEAKTFVVSNRANKIFVHFSILQLQKNNGRPLPGEAEPAEVFAFTPMKASVATSDEGFRYAEFVLRAVNAPALLVSPGS
jgi:hypothetical protein